MENQRVPESELEKPIGNFQKTKLPLLPELEMMEAVIESVTYQFAMFNGKPAYITNENGENVLDKNNQPIQKKEFSIKFSLKAYQLNNGQPRSVWLRVGASWNDKSKLKKLMSVLGFEFTAITPKVIINSLTGVVVKFQVVNKPSSNGEIYQNINFDSIRLVSKPKVQSTVDLPDDIQWKD